MNVGVHAARTIVCWVLMLLATSDAQGESGGTSPLLYSAYGQLFTHETMTGAYARVKHRYVVDLDSQQCVPVSRLKARQLRGVINLSSTARMLIKASDGRTVALLGIRGPMPKIGDSVDIMVIRSGAETLSVRDKNREVIAIAQYRDVTMTFADFAGFFRDGQHFPEAPELKTRPGRKGLFSAKRVQGSKVAEHLERLGSNSTNRGAAPEINGYDGFQPGP